MASTSTTYHRRTITGGRKSVEYYTNGHRTTLHKGRTFNGSKMAIRFGTSGYGTRVGSRAVGAHGGTMYRVTTIKRHTGNGRIKAYSVGRNTSATQARIDRKKFIQSKGGTFGKGTAVINHVPGVTFIHGTNYGKIRRHNKNNAAAVRRGGHGRRTFARDGRGRFR